MGPAKRSQDHGGDDDNAMARRNPHCPATPTAAGSESPALQQLGGAGSSNSSGGTGQQIPIRDNNDTSSASRRKRKRGGDPPTADGPDSDPGPRPHPPPPRRPLAAELGMQASCPEEDRRAVELAAARCDVLVHSVLSSSKMQKKVASVLRHLDVHPYAAAAAAAATDTSRSSSSNSSKPRVSVLRARACDAGKLVGIAEIAKREIGGVWFQYMALGEEVRDVARGEDTVVEETRLEGGKGGDHANKDDNGAGEGDDDGGGGDDDDFEIMKTPFERAVEGTPKKRAVAIVSLFLARVSINELKQRFGEQTI